MYKLSLAAVIGLAAAISTASADPILLPAPDPIPELVFSAHGVSPYDSPSFHRLEEMCAAMGFDCSAPADAASSLHFGSDPLAEAARADAEKRLALYMEEWEAFADEYHDSIAPAYGPSLLPPATLFGYVRPYALPRPRIEPFAFGHLFPRVPRIQVPHGYSIPGHGFSHGSIRNNPVFPWPAL